MVQGIKHLVACQCVLSQFKSDPNPPLHQFVVFSVLGDDNSIQVKLVQCNNCGIVHRIVDVCKSEILKGREDVSSILSLDDIKMGLPDQLISLLERHDADYPTWEQAKWILENERWGEFVVLSSDVIDGMKQTKILQIIGTTMFRLNSHVSDVYI